MLDKGLRLIQQAADLQHVPGPVLKRNAQFPLDRRFIKAGGWSSAAIAWGPLGCSR